jgi:hypothetical protein
MPGKFEINHFLPRWKRTGAMATTGTRTLAFTTEQREQVSRLARCTILPGSWEKKFVKDMLAKPDGYLISPGQVKVIDALWHKYRAQLDVEPQKTAVGTPSAP